MQRVSCKKETEAINCPPGWKCDTHMCLRDVFPMTKFVIYAAVFCVTCCFCTYILYLEETRARKEIDRDILQHQADHIKYLKDRKEKQK